MKKIKFPTAQIVLLLIAVFVAILTWIVPSGEYDRLTYNKEEKTFTVTFASELPNLKILALASSVKVIKIKKIDVQKILIISFIKCL